jgi:hypothetical protein
MEIDKLTMVASGSTIPWRVSSVVGSELWDPSISEKYNFQFTHMFLDGRRAEENMINQKTYDYISPIVNKINPDDWYRIKMNLNPCANQILEHGMHIDNPTQREDAYTAVFYINDNDGYTIFKTGEKIQSVSNRLVVFPASLYHSGTTCTNTSMRIVLNLNFYKTNIKELVGDTECQC